MVWRDGKRVRLFTRRGFDWTDSYPRIVHSARLLRVNRFMIDGEAVVCGEDGISDFQRLHSREDDASALLYGFDLLAVDGADIRHERLDDRRAKLRQLLVRPDNTTPQAPQLLNALPWRPPWRSDLGPVRYPATLLGSTDEQTMRWFILVVALLLDPAAVLLLRAGTPLTTETRT